MKLTSGDVDAICGLVLDLCGIYLDESKGYLIETRLADLAQRAGCSSYADLARRVRRGDDVRLQRELVDAITTNETLFFRDMSPFEAMRHKAIPELIDSKANTPYPKRLRIWSAACSTGQEPYSIAMLLHDMLPDPTTWDIRIVGTDISDEAIARASRGWYAPHESARGLPPEYLARYFREEQGGWRVSDPIRACVCFERRNLLESFASLGKFDIVLCRNVAIYFTPAARSDLFHRVAAAMNPGGY
ncbi:MAG TPA: protein-glutamate O-methyltransferase CheR, partial [Lacipirellulaceae bacterium]|nr:protein-glutamate O-methyltransferase CheR [Lacipirellulaceae bacterium]